MDPLLASLQYGEIACFDLTRNLASISVRDQIVRACMLARGLRPWLARRKPQASASLPVLVVGAGICGMTAAVKLAQEGFDVEVIDPAAAAFSVQRQCQSRWLDVLQYDWPLDHWDANSFPWQRSIYRRRDIFPFVCEPARSSHVVQSFWDRDLLWHLSQSYGSKICLLWGRRLHSPPFLDHQGNLGAEFQDRSGNMVGGGTYSAVMLASGFGVEVCEIPNSPEFAGYKFWETDPFEDPTYDGLIPPRQDTVLISGSGDGGLQDFLRVLTRQPSARKIYEDLNLSARSIRLDRIHSLDHRLERASSWDSSRNAKGGLTPLAFTRIPYWMERHDQCLDEVRRIRTQSLHDEVIAYLSSRPKKTILISQFDYFNCQYVLNQFLALLFIECLGAHRDKAIRNSLEVIKSAEVTAISDAGKPALSTPTLARQCIGRPWDVTVTGQAGSVRANVVIIRHGVRPNSGFAVHQTSQHTCPRPLPPTHLHP